MPEDLKDGLERALNSVRLEGARKQLVPLLAQLDAARTAGNFDEATQLLSRWQQTVDAAKVVLPTDLQEKVRPTVVWIATESQRRGIGRKMQAIQPAIATGQRDIKAVQRKRNLAIGVIVAVRRRCYGVWSICCITNCGTAPGRGTVAPESQPRAAVPQQNTLTPPSPGVPGEGARGQRRRGSNKKPPARRCNLRCIASRRLCTATPLVRRSGSDLAAALTLAGILALAAVVTGLAAALTLAGILALAVVRGGRLVAGVGPAGAALEQPTREMPAPATSPVMAAAANVVVIRDAFFIREAPFA